MISAVVPCYNQERFIGECIESLLSQTSSVEVIVVDDGSTDDSWHVIKSFESRITAVRQANCGVSAARNRGLSYVTQEYVAYVDGDDLWDPGFAQAAESEIRRTDADWIIGSVKELSERGLGPLNNLDRERVQDPSVSLLKCGWGVPAQFLVRTRLTRAAGGFDEELRANEDLDHWLKLAAFHPKIVVNPSCIAIYRILPGSSSTRFIRLWETREAVWLRNRHMIPEDDLSDIRRQHLDNFYRYVMLPRVTSLKMMLRLLLLGLSRPEILRVIVRCSRQNLVGRTRVAGGRILRRIRRYPAESARP